MVLHAIKNWLKALKNQPKENQPKNIKTSQDMNMANKKKVKKGKSKIEKVMHEYKEGELHSGSKKGPAVKSRKQAIAIALSESRKAGKKIPKKRKK